MNRLWLIVLIALSSGVGGCGAFGDALTGHAGPAATAAGHTLEWEDLGQLMAETPLPDSALTPYWAEQFARLWADYVMLATLYEHPDTTRSLDYGQLMEDGRHLAQLAVARYRDSVVLAGIEPSDAEIREFYDSRRPYTRLDVRRVVLAVPSDAPAAERDRIFAEAQAIRDRLVGGADFVAVARQASTEPAQARGQVLAYQGHPEFSPAADSVVFRLQPGEISPVIAADDEFLIYRIETVRDPGFENTRDLVYQMMLDERRQQRTSESLEATVGDARRSVMEGATDLASQVARDRALAADRIPDGIMLVTWDGGDLSVEELRRLFLVREDMRQRFAAASEEEVHDYLMQLARDEILITAAANSGVTASAEDREQIAGTLADQLARVAADMNLSHRLVTNPGFDLDRQAYAFLFGVMERSEAVPWLGSFRVVLDPRYPVSVDESGAANAARRAGNLREAGFAREETDAEPPEDSSEEGVQVE